jgi:hypothetical protein
MHRIAAERAADIAVGSFVTDALGAPLVTMSAVPRNPTSGSSATSVVMGQTETNCTAAKRALFDHLVSDRDHASGNGEAERLGSRDVDDEIKFVRLQHW